MSHHASPPPYQEHASTPQAFRPAFRPNNPHSTAQGHLHKGHSRGHGCHTHHCCGHVHQPSIVVPTRPVSQTVYSETDHLLPGGRRQRDDGSGCCYFTIIAIIAVVFCIVQFVTSMPIDKIAWTNLESHSCITYATREYKAEFNVSPWNRQWTEICMRSPVVIHGQPHFPSRCEYRSGTVIGHFAIKHGEPDCVTYWSGYRDWGCTAKGSKTRHIEQHLMNVPANADYKEFCATTPVHFLDQEFSGADSCFNSIWGVYGQWFIYDPSC